MMIGFGLADGDEHPAMRICREADQALAAGDLAATQRLLERACRLAPKSRVPVVSLAAVLLQQRRPGAARLFEQVAHEHDLREAWIGLAAAHKLAGNPSGAASALAQALQRCAPSPDASFAEAASSIAQDAGAPGWVGLGSDGRVLVALLGQAVTVRQLSLSLDGVRVSFPLRACRVGAAARLLSGRLPDSFVAAQLLKVEHGGQALLGSPVSIAAITRVEGCVEVTDSGLSGWAWRPGDPEAEVLLGIGCAEGGSIAFKIRAHALAGVANPSPFARPRAFTVSAKRLTRFGAVRVVASDGHDLLGSPLNPSAKPWHAIADAPSVRIVSMSRAVSPEFGPSYATGIADVGDRPPTPDVAVVMPVYRGLEATFAALASVFETVGSETPIIVVDDATPEPALAQALDALAAAGRIRLIRNARNRGFPSAANAGIRAAAGRDVVLLNSDILTAGDWLRRLQAAAYSDPDIATATPLSNNATILSYPETERRNPVPGLEETRRLHALAAMANGDGVIEIPTAVGFCMYVRRDCLEEVGLFREDVFAQGYGEENDFCLRAHHLGWRHVAATGVFVAHLGGQSFGAAQGLLARNLRVLNQLHPGYDQLICDFVAHDPLALARKRLDAARWAAGHDGRSAVVIVTHDKGGGVERHVQMRCQEIERSGLRPIVVRPSRYGTASPGCRVSRGVENAHPNLVYCLPEEAESLAGLLRQERPTHIELHHALGHHAGVLELDRLLDVPLEVRLHDYALVCPRITLVDATRRYCGEPAIEACEVCAADGGGRIEEEIAVATLRTRSASLLRRARQVVAPSGDTVRRFARYFPDLPRASVQAWEAGTSAFPSCKVNWLPHPRAGVKVCVVGAITVDKGYDVLLAAARDAEQRHLPLDFVVVGHTCDDDCLLATKRVWVTGEFEQAEVEGLLRAQAADLAFLPSIWPETWCYALSDAWQAGLDVVAFDVGAPAERIRATNRGWLLPLGIPAEALNNAFLRLAKTLSVGYANAPPKAIASTI